MAFSSGSNNVAPTQGTPLLNATKNTNLTTENLTLYNMSTNDQNGDVVKNLVSWTVDSLEVLTLSFLFEGGSDDTTTLSYTQASPGVSVQGPIWNESFGYDGRGAYSFDGSNDLINLTSTSAHNITTGNFTISAWINTTDSNRGPLLASRLLAGDNGFFFEVDDDGTLRFWINGPETAGEFFSSEGTVNDGNWHHVALTRKVGENISMYIDGVKDVSNASAEPSFSGTTEAHIGRAKIATTKWYSGNIDEFQIWNRSLSQEQVLALSQNETMLIVSQETNADEEWQGAITPTDGFLLGTTETSNTITIVGTNNLPTQGVPLLNSTSPLNNTRNNLTVYNQSTADIDGDVVKNIIQWAVNSKPLLSLNLPFEGGSNSTYTKDYSTLDNNGEVVGATWESTGGFDGRGAYSFDGIDDYINFSQNGIPYDDSTRTVCLWVKPNVEADGTVGFFSDGSETSQLATQIGMYGDSLFADSFENDANRIIVGSFLVARLASGPMFVWVMVACILMVCNKLRKMLAGRPHQMQTPRMDTLVN